jgi:mono/diheme cytochrome c family protein
LIVTRRRIWSSFALSAAVALSIAAGRPLSRSETPIAARRSITTVWDSVYSLAQAARGESAYVKGCARCHGASLGGVDQSPPLAGSGFLGNWNGLPLSDLQERIRTTMPPDSIGLYDRPFVTDVIAYVLKANGFPAGAGDLSPETERLKTITVQSAKP